MNRWTFIRALPGGHRLFLDRENHDRLAIADQSGDGWNGEVGTPDQTDDGILYIDGQRPIEVGVRSVSLPLVEPDDTETHTSITLRGALMLASEYGLALAWKHGPEQRTAHIVCQGDPVIVRNVMEGGGVVPRFQSVLVNDYPWRTPGKPSIGEVFDLDGEDDDEDTDDSWQAVAARLGGDAYCEECCAHCGCDLHTTAGEHGDTDPAFADCADQPPSWRFVYGSSADALNTDDGTMICEDCLNQHDLEVDCYADDEAALMPKRDRGAL